MKEFKHLIQDGHLEEFDQLVTDTSHMKWTPVPDCPSTIDPDVTVEDIEKACERAREVSRQQYLQYKEYIESENLKKY